MPSVLLPVARRIEEHTAVAFDRQAWQPDAALVREVDNQFDRTIQSYRAHPDLISEHANHEESIRTGGYANRTLLELVQNAADALAGTAGAEDPNAGRVEIILDPVRRALYCANAGRPFSASGLTAVTMAHLSGKRGDEIGRFGLGFKSVLAVSRTPQVFSRTISFEFGSEHATRELADVAASKRYPVLRTATGVDAGAAFDDDPILAELGVWASTIVKLPDATNLDRLRAEIENFRSEFLLFVGAVREVRLRVLGSEPYETSHVSRDLGSGLFRIERPENDIEGDEWIVSSRMHAPSNEARRQVGEAVSRSEVKVTVAVPVDQNRLKIGQFWSYFPLQDTTSASALFNAPWSVNDDRTTLLRNDYNREILQTVASMFVDLMPLVTSVEDPAAHLDYLPARGRESHGFGDDLLTTHVPQIASAGELIPDANGILRNGSSLRPLDFAVQFESEVHRAWALSPNTGDDVPHWRCYSNRTRPARLQDLFIADSMSLVDPRRRDRQAALAGLAKRGHLSWLREWADGSDPQSAANALRTVLNNPKVDDIAKAKVIPTSDGMRALEDRNLVFLHRVDDIEIENAVFVESDFLQERLGAKTIEDLLRERGFRDLDPEAILNARLAQLPVDADHADLTRLWEAVLDVHPVVATKAVNASTSPVKVPTRDGGWAWPRQVLDIDLSLDDVVAPRLLARDRCVPEVAHRLGVVQHAVKDFPLEDEPHQHLYREAMIADLNGRRGPGERAVENVEFTPGDGPGPFSMLFLLRDAGAPDPVRAEWTAALLSLGEIPWICEDLDTGRTYDVTPPARWAIERAGVFRTTRGYRPLADVAAPSLLRFDGLVPLYRGPRQALDVLSLPDELEEVAPPVLKEVLESDLFPPRVADEVLVEFVLTASRLGLGGAKPSTIPARVKRAIEPHAPGTVFLATSDDQEQFLRGRERPYLRVSAEQVKDMVEVVGCQRFEDAFSFSMIIEGQQESQRVLDVYTGLRQAFGSRLRGVRLARTLLIAKRVTTKDGVEDQPLDWHLDGAELLVRSDADERQMLAYISDAFDLGLDNAQMSGVLQVGLNHQLELTRQQAQSIDDEAERLELYIGEDDLRDALPTGLWTALAAQGLVDGATSVAELFLTVYGSDSVRMLADNFRDMGFTDVPSTWAGAPAAISWVRKMGFGPEFAGQRNQPQPEEFVVPGAERLKRLHPFQKKISEDLRTVLTQPSEGGPAQKGMVELPTGSGKTRVATETVLKLFVDEVLSGTILWVAQSAELCEQAVQTFQSVWRYLGDDRPLTIGRLWDRNTVHEPDTEFSVVVATDAKVEAVMGRPEYEWLSRPAAVFIDEAHRAGGSTRYTTLLQWLGVDGRRWERPLVGLSATPFKGSAGDTAGTKALAARFGGNRLTAFETDAYRQLVKLGVLANVRHEVLPSGVDIQLSGAERSALEEKRLIDRNLYERIGRNEQRMKVLVEHILEQDPDWPILVFTPSVLSAQVLAASLRYRKVRAASVSGQTGRQERRDILKRFQDGEIQVLANCDLLVQGFDAPGVRALYIARPTFSPSAYIQMAGRGLRGKENGGKEECLIVDVADNWGAMNDFLGYRDYEELWEEHQG
ncbi:sacsin N-terminal ATP-binding-like domain-containing protein [Isoptericola sp. 178]|uniref:sacsin N-terminal ATP-binding-like domain-containing protein n=1 Tax=Isoptericola sp. 178 TaxID=3064651 RepID=UPI0027133DFF|nr:helicase-related protein [Isoptericola sp. 178]MDO8143625.1 helicase-related protein [Isoptericola sp. 178]